MNTLGNVSIDQLKRALTIREQIESLQGELAQLLGGEVTTPQPGRRIMSASTRAKMAASQKARWAERNGTPVKPKRKMSATARAAISRAAKARWKKAKAAGKTSLASRLIQ